MTNYTELADLLVFGRMAHDFGVQMDYRIAKMVLPLFGQMSGKNGGCVVKTSHLGRLHG
jgi:hypothetical protein